jgi:multisubunit Na+/H+ antiporter MnhC subunit
MRKVFEIGGLVAAAILIAFGVTALVMGVTGRSTVQSNLKQEQIYFGDAAKDPTVPKQYSKELVSTGAEARAFAKMMRGHTLEATKGLTYAQMGRFVAKPGAPAQATDGQGGTNDPAYAAVDPNTKQPASNPARNMWVTETALTTALNAAYMADRIALFGIVVGIALLLAGIGFAVLAIGGALRSPETALAFLRKRTPAVEGARAVPTA